LATQRVHLLARLAETVPRKDNVEGGAARHGWLHVQEARRSLLQQQCAAKVRLVAREANEGIGGVLVLTLWQWCACVSD